MKFTLDAAALERIFGIWNVPVPERGLVLFALRGCRPLSPAKGFARSLRLETVTPDYRRMRCAIGIWDRDRGLVFAAPGSTVPHRDNVKKAAARPGKMKGRGTNQLEPGFYTDLTKGEHLQGKPQGHAALRQTGYRFYRRARAFRKDAPAYTTRDPLFFGNPYDNLHCAWNVDPKQDGFRSAGCVVVAGWPHSPRLPDAVPTVNRNTGAWKIFHDLIYAAPQRKFPLLLLPGEDAAKALGAKKPGARLVYGSKGEAVKALQRRLAARGLYKGRVDGKLGVGAYRAWNAAGLR
jgi:hypothetical protein